MKSQKYVQIFKYLKEFSEIRSLPVRDIENSPTQYPEKIWLNDIPVRDIFENIIRPEFNSDNEYWLRIKKPKLEEPNEPKFGKLPKILELWIEPDSLLNENSVPKLKDSIYIDGIVKTKDSIESLDNELEKYINEKWLNDLFKYNEEYKEYLKAQKEYTLQSDTYKNIFRIFNKSEQFGEEYELVVGIGLLNHKSGSESSKIYRHILTQRVDITFDYTQKDSQIIISPNLEAFPQIETDSIIGLVELFDSQNVIDAERNVMTFFKEKEIDSLFISEEIDDALQMFIERISPDGSYINTLEKPLESRDKPTIQLAPALLLRKRNTKSFTALFNKIISNIEESGEEIDIPIINTLIGIHEDENKKSFELNQTNFTFENEPVYFPKESNDEQFQIVQRARTSNKVLVQGPPGTGKSHTISNLICHLLANGKKVLITAYTKRALEVLKDKLPPEFQDLTVNLLSSDSSSLLDLQKSVNAINDELSVGDTTTYTIEIEELEKRLKKSREEKSNKTNELTRIKESSTRVQDINDEYKGSLTEIAMKLESDIPKFAWYKDNYCGIEDLDIYSQLDDLIKNFEIYKSSDVAQFDFILPKIENLPSLEDVLNYASINHKLNSIQDNKNATNLLHCNNLDRLNKLLLKLEELYLASNKLQIDFRERVIESYSNNKAKEWESKLNQSVIILERIQKYDLKQIDRETEIVYNIEKSVKQKKSDALILIAYLKEGNPLSGITFKLKKSFLSKEIKERLDFIEGVLVNGSPCDTLKEFELVLQDLELKQDFNELAEIWDNPISNKIKYANEYNSYKNIYGETKKLLEIINNVNETLLEINSISGLTIKPFDSNQIKQLLDVTNYNILLTQHNELKDKFKKLSEYLIDEENLHPIKEEFLKSFVSLNHVTYQILLDRLKSISEAKVLYQEYQEKINLLKNKIPYIVEEILSGEFKMIDSGQLKKAIYFKHAQKELKKVTDNDYQNIVRNELNDLVQQEKKLIAQLASKKAWNEVLQRLQNDSDLKKHLNAWVLAIKKIGKTGKGKRAMKFRRIAQQEMEHCKDSIPCWIMPLYKVAETINPEQEMFDYVIIDEASQLGPDAIFLLYIAKNIIIVGDDKQTSPEYIGVDGNKMAPFIKEHLKGIPYSDYYGTEFSFFDHAILFCDGRIVLREHFRCMPEIIEFSDNHFYAPDGNGLYPLKQYSENRLEPLQSIYCDRGFTEGKGSRIVNMPEAEAIVEKIAEIIKNTKYNHKSIGVITLQGNQQASAIETLLLKKIGEREYIERKIICGNSSSFQGDERDIIFLSLVTATNHSRSALVKPEDERRFNVAMSRAIEQVWLFHSVHLEDLGNTNDLRYKLLRHFKNQGKKQTVLNSRIEKKLGSQPQPFDSWFEVEVFNDIVDKGYSVIPQYAVAKGKYIIDMVAVFNDGTKIAIECDGDRWHGPEHFQNDILRQNVLERCGWQFFRVRGHEYYTNRIKAMDPLWDMFSKTKSIDVSLPPTQKTENVEAFTDSLTSIEQRMDVYVSTESLRFYDSEIDEENDDIIEREVQSHSDFEKKNFYEKTPTLCYFNLFKTGVYIISESEIEDAEFRLPIAENEKDGFLLQCYKDGHINKVPVSVLLSKRFNKEYKNGLNNEGTLEMLQIIESDQIIGLFIDFKGSTKFKAHLTENISNHDHLLLKGNKVLYHDFDTVKYKILPINLLQQINRVVFQSFTSAGKPMTNNYYEKEWSIIKQYYASEPKQQESFEDKKNYEQPLKDQSQFDLFDKVVKANSTVDIKYIYNEMRLKVKIVDYPTTKNDKINGIQRINNHSPLAVSLMGRAQGEIVQVGNAKIEVEILGIED